MEIKFVKSHIDAILPRKKYSNSLTGDAGLDIFSVDEKEILPHSSCIINIGLRLASITPGYWFRIEPRSGLGFTYGLQPHLGIIDNGYRGEVRVKMYNFSSERKYIAKGTGVAQIVVYEMIPTQVSFVESEYDSATDRGDKGFGSSDDVK